MLSDEIERIRVRFQSPEFAQVRCLMRFDGHQCSEVLFGLPLDEDPARPRITSGLSALACTELYNLFDQAGLLVDQVPGCVTHPRWKELLNCNPPGYKKWAAFLASGPRGFHVNATPDWPYVWIDAIGPVSAAACDYLAVHGPWTSDSVQTATPTWSNYRTPQEWRTLRAGVGLSASESTWRNLRKDHPGDIQGEPGREKHMVRLSQKLATAWGLKLAEFDQQ